MDEETFQRCRRIGDAAALLAAYVVSGFANRCGDGRTLGAATLTERDAARLLGVTIANVREWRRRLFEAGLIVKRKTARGSRLLVCESEILGDLLFALRSE